MPQAAAPLNPGRIRLALLTIQVLFGINYLASKIIVDEMSPGAWATLRTSGAFGVVAVIALIGKRRLPPARDLWLLALAGLFGVVLNQGLFLEGLSRTTVSHSALICSQIPTFVLIISLVFGLEAFTWRKFAGFLCGIGGVLVLLEADKLRFDSAYLTGDLMTLANAASYAIFIVISRKVMARNDPLAATAVVFFFGAVGMALYGGRDLLAVDPAVFTPSMVGLMTYVVVGATVVTYFLNLWAVKRVQATRVAIFIFLQPVIAATLGVIFRGNEITPRFLVATALVFLALMLRDGRPRSRS